MNRFDAFYNIPVGLLSNIVDSPSTNVYYDQLNAQQQGRFVSLIEPIRDQLNELKRNRRRGNIFGSFDSLTDSIKEFNAEFNNYPNLRAEQIRKSIIICNRVAQFVNKTKLDTSNYILIPLVEKIKPSNYWIYGTSIFNSALIFSFNQTAQEDIEAFQQFIDRLPNVQIQILFQLLLKLGNRRALDKEQYILVNKKYKLKLSKIISLLKLSSVCDGQVIHIPFTTNRNPQIINRANLGLQNSYQQFNDSIHILSEYNYEKDILNKYLRLYHVVENFMFKIPIVELMALTHGNMFSIRNFKTLYSKIEKSEMLSLTEFIKAMFMVDRTPGVNFGQSIGALWNSLSTIHGYNAYEINDFLIKLRIPFTTINAANNLLNFYCSLVYQLRNSIVHNKETEYHILHFKLHTAIPFLMENFIFPSLEEICFKLIIDAHVKVKYTQPSLQLYEE